MFFFENICSFLPGAPFSRSFQEALCVHQTDTDLPGASFLAIEVPIFQVDRFSYRTDTVFSGAYFIRQTDTNIPGALFFDYRTVNSFPGTPF